MTAMSSQESLVILTRGLTRRFGEFTAVDQLNLKITRSEIFGLVGPDGAGKTTTLRLLSGLLDPTEGEVWVAGYDVTREAQAVKDRIGYMAQRFGLYGDLTVHENMVFYADLFGISNPERDELMPRLLNMTRMESFRRRLTRQLSGGMKQKLALMCTLLHHPQILLLDEPTTGVDPVSRRDFWAILYQLVQQGITVIVTTSYLDEAERCNRVALMHRGRLISCDAPEAFRNQLEERCFEVRCPDRPAAREVLLQYDGVLSVEPSGVALHLFLLDGRTSVEVLKGALTEKGLRPTSFKQIEPSLEDVFIALIKKVS